MKAKEKSLLKANSKILKCNSNSYRSENLMIFHHNIFELTCSQINQQTTANTEPLCAKEMMSCNVMPNTHILCEKIVFLKSTFQRLQKMAKMPAQCR